MAFLDDLNKAVSLFEQGMQREQTTQAFNRAAERQQELDQRDLEGFAQRQSQQEISNRLGRELLEAGAPVSRVQEAQELFGAPAVPTPDELINIGTQFGDEESVQVGQEIKRQLGQTTREEQIRREGVQMRRDRMKFERDLLLQQLRNQAKGSNKKTIPATSLNKIQLFDQESVEGQDILSKIEGNPELVGVTRGTLSGLQGLVDPEFGDFKAQVGRWFDAYRKRITGAQASEKEIALLQENVPNVSDTTALFKRKMQTILRIGETVRARQLDTLDKLGFEVDALKKTTTENMIQQFEFEDPEMQAASNELKTNPNLTPDQRTKIERILKKQRRKNPVR